MNIEQALTSVHHFVNNMILLYGKSIMDTPEYVRFRHVSLALEYNMLKGNTAVVENMLRDYAQAACDIYEALQTNDEVEK
jgi:hypothetical protein